MESKHFSLPRYNCTGVCFCASFNPWPAGSSSKGGAQVMCRVGAVTALSVTNAISTENTIATNHRPGSTWNYLFSRFGTWWVTSSLSRKINKRTSWVRSPRKAWKGCWAWCHEFSGYQLWVLEVLLSHSSLVMVRNPRNNASFPSNTTGFIFFLCN